MGLAHLEQLLQSGLARSGIRGASLGIIANGQKAVFNAGIADASGTQVTSDHLFSLGSIAKVWTAHLCARLVVRDLIGLHTPVQSVLPDFALSDAEAAKRITPFHLLTHTSGIDGDFMPSMAPADAAEYVKALADAPLLHRPGEQFSYCNAGYVVLGEAYRCITGRAWAHAVEDEILAVCGAHSALASATAATRPRITGWQQDGEANYTLPVNRPWGVEALAAWGDTAVGRSMDLLHYAEALWDRFDVEESTLMWAKRVKGPRNGDGWGLGWRRWRQDSATIVGHDGGVPGQTSFFRIAPDHRFAFVLLTSAENGGPLFEHLYPHACEAASLAPPNRGRKEGNSERRPLPSFSGRYRRFGVEFDVKASLQDLVAVRRIGDSGNQGAESTFRLEPLGNSLFGSTPAVGENGEISFQFVSEDAPEFLSTGVRLYRRCANEDLPTAS